MTINLTRDDAKLLLATLIERSSRIDNELRRMNTLGQIVDKAIDQDINLEMAARNAREKEVKS